MYTARHREDRDDANVIAGTFVIYFVPYFALVYVGSTHSYIASIVSMKLNISTKCTAREVSIVSPLG